MERPSRSLELLAKFVKTEEEKATTVVDNSERIQWDADAYIKTEAGKAWYYERIAMDLVPEYAIGTRMCYSELANYKYRPKEQE